MKYTKDQLKIFTKTKLVQLALNDFNATINGRNTKVKLIDDVLSIQEKHIQAQNEIIAPEVVFDESTVKSYMVRYIGLHSQLEHGNNATPSGKRYLFTKNVWTEVDKKDFDRKYYKKMKNAIDNNVSPHFECAKRDIDGNMVILHQKFLEKLGDRRIQSFADFRGMTEFHILTLNQSGIRSIRDFQGMPDEWLLKNLNGIDRQSVASWRDDALKGIKQSREEVALLIKEAQEYE